MSDVKKFWLKIATGSGFPFWETEITDNEELKNQYDDFNNSVCVVLESQLLAERAKSSSLQKIIDEVDDTYCFTTYCTGLRAEHERQLKAEQEKVKKLKEALGFYGDCENHKVFKIITHIDGVHFDLDQKVFRDGGKLARQALKEVESV